jgi:hypothetical protein
MRTFVVTIALLGLFAAEVRAADDDMSPVIGRFPDTANNQHVYLFMLKKNDISLKISPHDFCTKMGYGEAVYGEQPKELGDDDKPAAGKLEWVICRFPPN